MDTGNSNYTYEEYKELCKTMGVFREWEMKISYDMYLMFMENNSKKAMLTLHYNSMYFNEGSFN